MNATPLTACLACGGTDLKPFLDLGVQPLANDFGQCDGQRFPLKLNVCTSCWHSQNGIAVDPAILYSEYSYVSGTSGTLKRYFADFVSRVEHDFGCNVEAGLMRMRRPVPRPLRVLDIASNDGSLLAAFKARGHTVQGVEPAANVARIANDQGITTHVGFWGERMVETVQETDHPELTNQYDVIVAMNVLGHVADPLTFLQLAKSVLAPGGRIYVQTSQAHMIANAEFDTVYHEHLSFFTARSFLTLARRVELTVNTIEIVQIHGGSMFVEMENAEPRRDGGDYHLERREEIAGLHDIATYDAFQARVDKRIAVVRDILRQHSDEMIVVAGAAAKTMTLLGAVNAWHTIDGFIDENPLKIGHAFADTGVPVFGFEFVDVIQARQVLWLIGGWNFKTEIVGKIRKIRPNADDMFLTCFPDVTLEWLR